MQAYCAYILHLSICIAVSKNNYLLKTIDKYIDKFIIFKKIIAAIVIGNGITLKRYIYRFMQCILCICIYLYVSLLQRIITS